MIKLSFAFSVQIEWKMHDIAKTILNLSYVLNLPLINLYLCILFVIVIILFIVKVTVCGPRVKVPEWQGGLMICSGKHKTSPNQLHIAILSIDCQLNQRDISDTDPSPVTKDGSSSSGMIWDVLHTFKFVLTFNVWQHYNSCMLSIILLSIQSCFNRLTVILWLGALAAQYLPLWWWVTHCHIRHIRTKAIPDIYWAHQTSWGSICEEYPIRIDVLKHRFCEHWQKTYLSLLGFVVYWKQYFSKENGSSDTWYYVGRKCTSAETYLCFHLTEARKVFHSWIHWISNTSNLFRNLQITLDKYRYKPSSWFFVMVYLSAVSITGPHYFYCCFIIAPIYQKRGTPLF